MPFYRYVCQSCDEEFRVLHAADSTESVTCPNCGSQEAERQLPRVAVQFKGSGYYKTDRDPKRSKAGTKSLAKSSGSGSSDEKSSDSSKASSQASDAKSDSSAGSKSTSTSAD